MPARPLVHLIHTPDVIRLILHVQPRQINDESNKYDSHKCQSGNNDYFKHNSFILLPAIKSGNQKASSGIIRNKLIHLLTQNAALEPILFHEDKPIAELSLSIFNR